MTTTESQKDDNHIISGKAESIDIEKLRELAQAAKPGPWKYNPVTTEVECDFDDENSCSAIVYVNSGDFTHRLTIAHGQFIAAANPAVILALIDHIAHIEAVREKDRVAAYVLGCAEQAAKFAAHQPCIPEGANGDCQSCDVGQCTTGPKCVTLGKDDPNSWNWQQRAEKAEAELKAIAERQAAEKPYLYVVSYGDRYEAFSRIEDAQRECNEHNEYERKQEGYDPEFDWVPIPVYEHPILSPTQQEPASPIADFITSQKPLDADIAKVISDNAFDLYATDEAASATDAGQELKNCFCGGKPVIQKLHDGWQNWIECGDCSNETARKGTLEQAKEEWQRIAAPAQATPEGGHGES